MPTSEFLSLARHSALPGNHILRIIRWMFLLAIIPVGLAYARPGLLGPDDFEPGVILVKFQTALSRETIRQEAAALGLANTETARLQQAFRAVQHVEKTSALPRFPDVERWQLAPGQPVVETVHRVSHSALVEYSQPNYCRRILTPLTNGPNDPYYQNGSQWWLSAIQADRVVAENKTPLGSAVVVAIVDSGIRLTHEDLAARLVLGHDFVLPGGTANDDEGHGTHVAGIVGALTNNGRGIAGVIATAPVRLMPIKVLDSAGEGYDSDIAQGIRWAADHGARVQNLSFGSTAAGQVLEDAIEYAYAKGSLCVAAAGNNAVDDNGNVSNPIIYPAAYDRVLAVAACTASGNRAGYSEYQTYVALTAPGGEGGSNAQMILSTYHQSDQAYAYAYGTSMAAPMVAGVAAMLWVQDATRSPGEVRQRMLMTADKIGNLTTTAGGWNSSLGWGRVNLYQALNRTITFQAKTNGRASYNFPNPFQPAQGEKTSILIPVAGSAAQLRIFDSLGHEVYAAGLSAEQVYPGAVMLWDGRGQNQGWVANGVYPYVLDISGATYTNKIVVLNK